MGMDIKIRIVGRKNGSEAWLEDAYSMYDTRLRPSPIDVVSEIETETVGKDLWKMKMETVMGLLYTVFIPNSK